MSDEIYQEFILDSIELIDIMEDCFCKLSKGENINDHYDKIYRCLHSIKGASGMFDLLNVSNVTHEAEDALQTMKARGRATQNEIDYFMKYLDIAKDYIQRNDSTSAIMLSLTNKIVKATPAVATTHNIAPILSVEVQITQPENSKNDPKLFNIEELKKELKTNVKPVILIVDDEIGVHKLIKKMISVDSLIINALNVTQAITTLDLCSPHLIITDIKMPGESGIDLLKILSKNHPNIPVVMISGNPSTKTTIDALNNGALYFLEKPFSKSDLQSVTKKGLMKRMRNYIVEMKINHA